MYVGREQLIVSEIKEYNGMQVYEYNGMQFGSRYLGEVDKFGRTNSRMDEVV
jgi:hypothetical protein